MPAAGGFWQVVSPQAWPACWAWRATPPRPTPSSVPAATGSRHRHTSRPALRRRSQRRGQLAVAPLLSGAQSMAAPGLPCRPPPRLPETLVPATSGTLPTSSRRRASSSSRRWPATSRRSTSCCPCRRGWSQVPDPNVPDAFAVHRRPGRRRRHLHLQRRARRLQAGRRRLRPQGGHHPRLHRRPAAAGLAHHQRVAGRLRRHAVVDRSRAPTARTT